MIFAFYASVRYVLRELCKWFESHTEKAAESCLDMTEKMTLNGRLAKFKSRKAVNPCSASSVFNAHSTKNLTDRLSVTWIFRVKNIKITANRVTLET